MMRKIVVALAIVATLSGCSVFKRGEGRRPKTAVLGERVPVLAAEASAVVDPTLAAVPVTIPPAEPAAGWPQPGADAAKSGGNRALGPSLARAWNASIPGSSPRARYGGAPIVADGRVYVQDSAAVVHAFALDSGRRLWSADLGTGARKDKGALFGGAVSFEDNRLYATTGLGDVVALEAATGKEVWRKRPGGPLRGAPALGGDGNAYVVSQDNQIFALRTDTGDVGWTATATLVQAGVLGVAAPAIARGTVVAGFSSGELSALRYENGRVVWQDQLARTSISTAVASISDIDASPVIDGAAVYAIGEGGRMVAMDLVGGQRRWEISIAGIDTPWLAGEWLFVVTDQAKLVCVERTTGKIRWVTQLEGFTSKSRNTPIQWSGPVLAGGRLLVTSDRGRLAEVSPTDGKVLRDVKVGKRFDWAPVVAGNTMILLDRNGALTAWR